MLGCLVDAKKTLPDKTWYFKTNWSFDYYVS